MSYLGDLRIKEEREAQSDPSGSPFTTGSEGINDDIASLETLYSEHEDRFGNGFDPMNSDLSRDLVKRYNISPVLSTPLGELPEDEFVRLDILRNQWKELERKHVEAVNVFNTGTMGATMQDYTQQLQKADEIKAQVAEAKRAYLENPVAVLQHLSQRSKRNVPNNEKYSAFENELIQAGNTNPDALAEYRAASLSSSYPQETGERPEDFLGRLSATYQMFSATANLTQSRDLALIKSYGYKEEYVTDKQLVEGVPEAYHQYLLDMAHNDGDQAALLAKEQLSADMGAEAVFDRMDLGQQLGYGVLAYALMPETWLLGGVLSVPERAAAQQLVKLGINKTTTNAVTIGAVGGTEEAILAAPRLEQDITYTTDEYVSDVLMGVGFGSTLSLGFSGVQRALNIGDSITESNKKAVKDIQDKQKTDKPVEPKSAAVEEESAVVDANTANKAAETTVGVQWGEISSLPIAKFKSVVPTLRKVHQTDATKREGIPFLVNNQMGLVNKYINEKAELTLRRRELESLPDGADKTAKLEELAKEEAAAEVMEEAINELNATVTKIALAYPDGKAPPAIQAKIKALTFKQVDLVTDNIMDRLIGGLVEPGKEAPKNMSLLKDYADYLKTLDDVHAEPMSTQEFVGEFSNLLYGQGIEIKKTNQMDSDDPLQFIDDGTDASVSGADLNPEDLAGMSTDLPPELSILRDIMELNKRYAGAPELETINGVVALRLRTKLLGMDVGRYKDSTTRFSKKVERTPDEVKAEILGKQEQPTPAQKKQISAINKKYRAEIDAHLKPLKVTVGELSDIIKSRFKKDSEIKQEHIDAWKFYQDKRTAALQEIQDSGLPMPAKLSPEEVKEWYRLKNSGQKVSEDVQTVGRSTDTEIGTELKSDVDRVYSEEVDQVEYQGASDETINAQRLRSDEVAMSDTEIENTLTNISKAVKEAEGKELTQAELDKLYDDMTKHGMDGIPKELHGVDLAGVFERVRGERGLETGTKLIKQHNLEQPLVPRQLSKKVEQSAYKDRTVESIRALNKKLKEGVLDELGVDNLRRAGQRTSDKFEKRIEKVIERIKTEGTTAVLKSAHELGDLRAVKDLILASKEISDRHAKAHRVAQEAEKAKRQAEGAGTENASKKADSAVSTEEILSTPITEDDLLRAEAGTLDEIYTPEEVAHIEQRIQAVGEELNRRSLNKIKDGMGKFTSSGEERLTELSQKPATKTDYVGRIWAGLVKELSKHFLEGGLTTQKYIGARFTEVAAGFGGHIKRPKTAAIRQLHNQNQLKTMYAKAYHDAISAFVASKGRGAVAQWFARWGEAHTNKFVAEFDRNVFTVLEYRRQGKPIPDSIDPSITKFCDEWQKFTDFAHDMAVDANLNGFKPNRKVAHYIPHVWVQGKFKRAIREHGIPKVEQLLTTAYQKAKDAGTSYVKDPAEMARELIRNVLEDNYDALDSYVPLLEDKVPGMDARAKRRVDLDTTTELDGLSVLDLLDTEVINVANKYSNRIAGYSAIAKATDGMITSPRDLRNLKELMIMEGAEKNIDTKKTEKLFDDVVDMLLGRPTRGGLPQEIRQIKQLAFLTKLGGLGTAQLTETGQVITRAVLNMFSDKNTIEKIIGLSKESEGYVDLMREVQSLSSISNDLDLLHRESTNYDDGLMESINPLRRLSKYLVDKGTGGQLRAPGARALTQVSLFNSIKRGQSRIVQASFVIDAAKHFKSNSGKMDNRRRADIGLTDPDGRNELLEDVFNNIVEYDANGLPTKLNIDKWPPDAREEFALAMLRDEAQTIQKALVGELPQWLNSPFWSLMLQFRQFGLLAMNKQLRRSASFADKQAVFDVLLNTASAGLVRYAKFAVLGTGIAAITGESDPEENLWNSDLADVDLHKYVSQFGIYPDAVDLVLSAKDVDKPGEAWELLSSEIPTLSVAADAMKLATTDSDREKIDAIHGLTMLGNTALGDMFYAMLEEQLLDE